MGGSARHRSEALRPIPTILCNQCRSPAPPAVQAFRCVTPCNTARPCQSNKWTSFSGQHNANTVRRAPPSLSRPPAETATNSRQRRGSLSIRRRSCGRRPAAQLASVGGGTPLHHRTPQRAGARAAPPMKRHCVSAAVPMPPGPPADAAAPGPFATTHWQRQRQRQREDAATRSVSPRNGPRRPAIPVGPVGGGGGGGWRDVRQCRLTGERRPLCSTEAPPAEPGPHCAGAHLCSAAQPAAAAIPAVFGGTV